MSLHDRYLSNKTNSQKLRNGRRGRNQRMKCGERKKTRDRECCYVLFNKCYMLLIWYVQPVLTSLIHFKFFLLSFCCSLFFIVRRVIHFSLHVYPICLLVLLLSGLLPVSELSLYFLFASFVRPKIFLFTLAYSFVLRLVVCTAMYWKYIWIFVIDLVMGI